LSNRIAGFVLLTCAPLLAHHSLEAQFDTGHPVTLRGTVTKVEWSNPHIHLHMDVMDANTTVSWLVEMGSPNGQLSQGWKIDSFKQGDRVTVEVNRARDGSNFGYARKITKTSR
jgi:hypothetical protein